MVNKTLISGLAAVLTVVILTAIVFASRSQNDSELKTLTLPRTTVAVITEHEANNSSIAGDLQGAGPLMSPSEHNSAEDYDYDSPELCSANTSRVTNEPTSVQVDSGATVEFLCTGDNLGHCSVFWLKGNHHYVSSNELVIVRDQRLSVTISGIRGSVLTIRDVRASDAGDYTCKVHRGDHVLAQITHSLKIK